MTKDKRLHRLHHTDQSQLTITAADCGDTKWQATESSDNRINWMRGAAPVGSGGIAERARESACSRARVPRWSGKNTAGLRFSKWADVRTAINVISTNLYRLVGAERQGSREPAASCTESPSIATVPVGEWCDWCVCVAQCSSGEQRGVLKPRGFLAWLDPGYKGVSCHCLDASLPWVSYLSMLIYFAVPRRDLFLTFRSVGSVREI